MQFRKIAAVAGSALMAGMTLAVPIMAATNVGNIASLATPDPTLGTANFPIFVIGKTAQTSDVAGAIGIAVRMAAESKTTTTVTTTSSSAAITGLERDGIAPGTTVGGSRLNQSITGVSAMPSVFLNTHYSKLKDSTYSWKSNDYDYREQVDASGLLLRHKIDVTNINGTEKIVADTSDAKTIAYEYVFDKAINLSTATTAGNTGTIGTPEYSNPIKIQMLGKDFTIVGVGASSVKMLSGTIGTTKKQGTDVTGVAYGKYKIYTTAGSEGGWASFEIKDASGNVVDTISGIYADDGSAAGATSKDSSVTGLTVKVTNVRVTGTDPATQIVEADIVVGPTGQVEHEYDGTADVDTTGSSNEAFPGTTRWGIQYTATGGGNGYIPNGAKIQVIYKPKEAEYYKFGEKISLPNNFADLMLEGWNTDKFATITVKPTDAKIVYNSTTKAQVQTSMFGLEISSDKSGTIKSGGSYYDKAYILVNASTGSNVYPIAIGYYDTDKILVNDAFRLAAPGAPVQTGYGYAKLDTSAASTNNNFTYAFTINAGETDFYLNVTFGNVTSAGAPVITNLFFDDTSASVLNGGVNITYLNATPWVSGDNLGTRFFKLGATASSSEEGEVQAFSEGGSIINSGKKSQTELVTDAGILLLNPDSNGASDQVKVMIPSKALAVKAYFGKSEAAATTGGTTTSSTVIPVRTDVVKLDTEVADPTTLNNNVVLVGGPCVNTLVASLAASGKFPYTCDTWPAENAAWVSVIQDAFQTGKVAVVVAGTRAQDTDLASLAVQSDALLGRNATSVKLSGTDLNTLMIS